MVNQWLEFDSWPGPWCRYARTQFPSTLVARPVVSVRVHPVSQHTRGSAPGVNTRALSSSAHSWPGPWCRYACTQFPSTLVTRPLVSVHVLSVPQHTRGPAPFVGTRALSSPAHSWPGPLCRYACTQFPSTLVAWPLVSVRVHSVPQHTRGPALGVGTRARNSPAHSWPGPLCRYACTQFPITHVAWPLVSVRVHSVPQHTRGPALGVGTRARNSPAHSWPGHWCRYTCTQFPSTLVGGPWCRYTCTQFLSTLVARPLVSAPLGPWEA